MGSQLKRRFCSGVLVSKADDQMWALTMGRKKVLILRLTLKDVGFTLGWWLWLSRLDLNESMQATHRHYTALHTLRNALITLSESLRQISQRSLPPFNANSISSWDLNQARVENRVINEAAVNISGISGKKKNFLAGLYVQFALSDHCWRIWSLRQMHQSLRRCQQREKKTLKESLTAEVAT